MKKFETLNATCLMTKYIDRGHQDLHLTKKTPLKMLPSSFYDHFSDFFPIF